MNDTHPRIRDLLLAAVEAGASDLHIVAGDPPTCRHHGRLKPVGEQPLDGETIAGMLASLCPDGLFDVFRERKDLDFSFEIEADGRPLRFRANFFFNQQNLGACFRLIPSKVPSFEWAGFPDGLAQRLAHFRNGLVLLTGVAGSGNEDRDERLALAGAEAAAQLAVDAWLKERTPRTPGPDT